MHHFCMHSLPSYIFGALSVIVALAAGNIYYLGHFFVHILVVHKIYKLAQYLILNFDVIQFVNTGIITIVKPKREMCEIWCNKSIKL
jgi:hypothetical protein